MRRLRIPDGELLRVLDARLAGKSLREMAIDLYGERRVAEDWSRDGSMKARVRWRVKRALWLMKGGYRVLVAGG